MFVLCLRGYGGPLQAWLECQSHAQEHGLYPRTFRPGRHHQISISETFLVFQIWCAKYDSISGVNNEPVSEGHIQCLPCQWIDESIIVICAGAIHALQIFIYSARMETINKSHCHFGSEQAVHSFTITSLLHVSWTTGSSTMSPSHLSGPRL